MFQNALKRVRRTVIRTIVTGGIVVGTAEVTTHLPTQGRSSKFYHYVSDEWVTPTMRKLSDPESAHNMAVFFAKNGLTPQHHPSATEQRLNVSQTVFGVEFPNPIGLGAGFDKDGIIIEQMLKLGFGFVEIGTVTPQPQTGNPKPRMFRLMEDRAIINRYGFNSQGAHVVEQNLEAFRHPSQKEASMFQSMWSFLYPYKPPVGMVGVNIGKNKSSEDAVADYVFNIQKLGPYADFMVINVSSPNTAGLRDLQQPDSLESLIKACLKARSHLQTRVPLLVKLAPDLTDEELKQVADVALKLKIDGIVVTNTTKARPESLISKYGVESGGLSGEPIKDKSTECIRRLFVLTDGEVPLIGVGGVGSGHDAYEKLKAGASLVEVYSMMVYKGPGVVSRIRHELATIMLQNGQRSIEDVIGVDHDEIFQRRRQKRLEIQRRETGKLYI